MAGSQLTNSILQQASSYLARLAPEYFASKLQNPYFIIGCGRSGTTLLANTLALHQEIALYPSEANHLWHPRFYPWGQSEFRGRTPPFGFDPQGFTRLSLEYRSSLETKRIRSSFGAFHFLAGVDTFLNKSAMITFMIPYIIELFPDAKLIHIVRDGRAVALSWARKEYRKIQANSEACRAHGIDISCDSLLRAFAESWKLHVQEVDMQSEQYALGSQGKLYELRYEDFCLDPRSSLRELAEFMNVAAESFDRLDYSHITSRNYKHREELEPNIFRELTRIMAPALRVKGYS